MLYRNVLSVLAGTAIATWGVSAYAQDGAVPVEDPVPLNDTNDDEVRLHEAITYSDGTVDTLAVPLPPPEPLEEVVDPENPPAEDLVWVEGYWRWDGVEDEYEWVPGVWRKEIPGQVWHPGRWVKVDDGYVRRSGYWGPSDTQLLIVEETPPEIRAEVQSNSPGTDYVWVSGSWVYEGGQYIWREGYWAKPAYNGAVWVPPQWVATLGGYQYIPGHWDHPVESRVYVVTAQADPATAGKLSAEADADKDGKLSLKEIRAVRPHYEEANFSALDADRDGLLSAQELINAGSALP